MGSCPLCTSKKFIEKKIYNRSFLNKRYKSDFGIDVVKYLLSEKIALYQCLNCKLQYFNPINEADDTIYEDLCKHDWYYMEDKYEYDYAIDKILEIKPDSILEVGCGKGYFLEKLKDSFYVRGTEENNIALQELNKKGIIIDDGQSRYDFIAMFQVLEHIQNLKDFLNVIINKLKIGGHFLITTPNPESIYMKEVLQILDFPPHHTTRWVKDAFEFIATEFKMEVVDYFREPILPIHLTQLIQSRRAEVIEQKENIDSNKLLEFDNAIIPYLLFQKNIYGHTHGILLKRR